MLACDDLREFLQTFQSQDGNTEGENTGGTDTEIEGENAGGETFAEMCELGKLDGKWSGRDWGEINFTCRGLGELN